MMVVGFMIGARRPAIMRGMHIGNGARHQDAVEMIEQGAQIHRLGNGRDHHRQALRHVGNGADIFVAQRVEQQVVVFIGVGRQADEGMSDHGGRVIP